MTKTEVTYNRKWERYTFVSDVFMHYMEMKFPICYTESEFDYNRKLNLRIDSCMLWMNRSVEKNDFDQPYPWDVESIFYQEEVWNLGHV